MKVFRSIKQRAPVSRRTLPNLPWDFRRDPPLRQVFVLGVANKRAQRIHGKPWPIVYKYVRWCRLSILISRSQEEQDAKVKAFIERRTSDIIKEGLRSVHTVCVVDRSHLGEETVTITPIPKPC